jgi:hypothetical protein
MLGLVSGRGRRLGDRKLCIRAAPDEKSGNDAPKREEGKGESSQGKSGNADTLKC